jgi:hypothetical protein
MAISKAFTAMSRRINAHLYKGLRSSPSCSLFGAKQLRAAGRLIGSFLLRFTCELAWHGSTNFVRSLVNLTSNRRNFMSKSDLENQRKIEMLQKQLDMLLQRHGKRIRLTDDERRVLAVKGKALAVKQWVLHYHGERAHQGLDNRPDRTGRRSRPGHGRG